MSLYELACLDVPFKAESMRKMCQKVVKGAYKPIPKEFSDELKFVVKKMLSVRPSDRPSCRDLLNSYELGRHISVEQDLLVEPEELIRPIRLPDTLRGVKPGVFPAPRYHGGPKATTGRLLQRIRAHT